MKGRAKKILGTKERPRLRPKITSKHIYAQLIDDLTGTTIAAASTVDKEFKKAKLRVSRESAKTVGKLLAARAMGKGIKAVVFDRGQKLYHGRIKELADQARAEGLKF